MGKWIKRHKGLFITLCVLTVVIGFIAFVVINSISMSKKMMEALTKNETVEIERRDLVETVSATGTVTSSENKTVTAYVSAEITDVLVSVGDQVKEGDLLCVLDSSAIQTNLEIAELNLKNSGSSLDSARRQYSDAVNSQNYNAQSAAQSVKNAETTLNNAKNTTNDLGNTYLKYNNQYEQLDLLVKKYTDGAPTADIDAVKAKLKEYEFDVTKPGNLLAAVTDATTATAARDSVKTLRDSSYKTYIDYANTTLTQAQSAYDSAVAQQNYSATTNASSVNSAAAGINTAKTQAEISQMTYEQQIETYKDQLEACQVKAPFAGTITSVTAAKGNQYASGTTILTIEDTSAYEISTEIDEYSITKIKVGQEVVIKTNGTGDLELKGKIKSIAPRATTSATSTKVTYKVVITVDTPCDDIRLDMTAKLSIIIEKTENTVTVPYESVQTDDDGKKYIMIQTTELDEFGKNIEEKVYVETGIESDYYIEILNADDLEGKIVVVPRSDESFDIYSLLEEEGALGGF